MKDLKNLLMAIVVGTPMWLSAQSTITLRPDGTTGKDASILSCIPCGFSTNNYGTSTDYTAAAWTNSGDDSHVRGLVEFDLSGLPAAAVITQASLSLYYNPTPAHTTSGHESLSGSNTSVLQRITSIWDENTVTWNTQPSTSSLNEVTLAESTSSTQDYPNINVTNMVQDMVDNPATSYGFMLRAVTEDPYRKLTFASSDHADTSLHPKLVITYIDVTSVPEIENLATFTMYPNPASNVLTINTQGENVETLELLNVNGQVIQTIDQVKSVEVLSTEDYTSGVYFVRMRANNTVLTKKLIIE